MTGATAIIVAAGAGSRLADPTGLPKALRAVRGRPMYLHSLQTFDVHPSIGRCVLVYPAIWEAQILEELPGAVGGPVELVAGGATRRESVFAGLGSAGDAEIVVVHDAARPFVSSRLIDAVLAACAHADAAITAIPVTDTIKRVSGGAVAETLERGDLAAVQTPQAFRREILARAHEQARVDGIEATDDSVLVERLGVRVAVVPGDERNIKITTQTDLDLAQGLPRARAGS